MRIDPLQFKLATLFAEASGRETIYVRKVLIDICGGNLYDGIILSRILYWHLPSRDGQAKLKVEKDGLSWLAKGHADWWDECRVNEHTARKVIGRLKAMGLVLVKVWKFPAVYGNPTVHIHLVWQKLVDLLLPHIAALEDDLARESAESLAVHGSDTRGHNVMTQGGIIAESLAVHGSDTRGHNVMTQGVDLMPSVDPIRPLRSEPSGLRGQNLDKETKITLKETTHTDPEGPIAPPPQPEPSDVCEPDRSASTEPNPEPPPDPTPPVEPPESEPPDRSAASSSPSQKYELNNRVGSGFVSLGDAVGAIAPLPQQPPPPSIALAPAIIAAASSDPGQKTKSVRWGGKYQHPTAKFEERMRAATADPAAKSGASAFHVLMREDFRALMSIGDEAWKLVTVTGDDVDFTELAIAGAKTIMPDGVPEARVKAYLIKKAKSGTRTELRNLIAAGEEAVAKKSPSSGVVVEALPFIPDPAAVGRQSDTKKDPLEDGPEKDPLFELRGMYHADGAATVVRATRMGIAGKLVRDMGIELETVRGYVYSDVLAGEVSAAVGVSILVDTLKVTREASIERFREEWEGSRNVRAAEALKALDVVVRDTGPDEEE